MDHPNGLRAVRRHAGVFLQQLRVAQDAVEWRAQLVADGGDVACLGLVGLLGRVPRLLQRFVGALVRFDFLHQQPRLPVRLFLRHFTALVRQHQPPGHGGGDQQQHRVNAHEARAQSSVQQRHVGRHTQPLAQTFHLLPIEQAQHRCEHRRDHHHEQQVVREACLQVRPHAARHHVAQRADPLLGQARVRLAKVATAGVQRAAERADVALISRAMRHIGCFVLALADDTPLERVARQHSLFAPPATFHFRPRNVVPPLRQPRNRRRRHQRGHHRDHRRKRLCTRSQQPHVRHDGQSRCQPHRTHTHGVDVVEVSALELDALGRPAQWLVDHQIGHHGHDPCDGDVGVQAQHLAQRLKHVHLHQHEGNQRVEHHPHHAPRVAVGDAREEVAPGERAGIGVGDVDLELRNHHEKRGGRHRPAVIGEHELVGRQVHLVRVHRALGRHHVADGQVREQRAPQHLDDAQHHPAGPAREHTQPPAPGLAGLFGGHEAQVVGLLAHLRDERNANGERRTKQVPFEDRARTRLAPVPHHVGECLWCHDRHGHERHHHHHQPQGLGPHLETADDRHTMRHQRNHHQRTDEVAPGGRYVQCEFERVGHDGRFQREKDEGERGVDQRGDGGADVAEARTSREQVHVDAMARGVDADGQAGQKDDEAGAQNRQGRVHKSVLHQQRGAHGFKNQERSGAERRIGHAPFRPLPKALRRVAQRVVFHGLTADPAVVIPTHLYDALRRRRLGRVQCRGIGQGVVHTGFVQLSCHAARRGTGIADQPLQASQKRTPAPPWNSRPEKKTSC